MEGTSSKALIASSYRRMTSSLSRPTPYCLRKTSVSSSPSSGSPLSSATSACCAASISLTLVPKPEMADPFATMPSYKSSRSSAVPTPCSADTGRGSPRPRFQNCEARYAPFLSLSHLFTASRTGWLLSTFFRRNVASCSSMLVGPTWPSTTRTTPALSSMAIMACSRISLANRASLSSKTRPPVSTNWNFSPRNSPLRYVRSRVMPSSSATMAPPDCCPASLFTRADLPTFGLPTTAIRGTFLGRRKRRMGCFSWGAAGRGPSGSSSSANSSS